MTNFVKTSLDQLKSNYDEHQTATNHHFDELENDLNGLEINKNETELVLKNHTDQLVELETNIDELEVKTKAQVEDLHPTEGMHLNCSFN